MELHADPSSPLAPAVALPKTSVLRETPVDVSPSGVSGRGGGGFRPPPPTGRLKTGVGLHLARVANIQRRFAFLQNLSTSSLAVLDTVPAAIMLLDGSARTLHRNAAAEAELRRADLFSLTPSDEIRVRGAPTAQAAARTAIGSAIDPLWGGVNEGFPTVAQVSRRNGELLSVQALPIRQGHRTIPGTMIGRRVPTCALVVHGVTSRIPTLGLQLLRHFYGLTPAEVRVAHAIAEDETLKRYAERRGISRNTAASQLKRAFEKTGLKRQSELLMWLLLSGTTFQSRTTR